MAFSGIGTTTALAPRIEEEEEGANGNVIPPLYLFAGKKGRGDEGKEGRIEFCSELGEAACPSGPSRDSSLSASAPLSPRTVFRVRSLPLCILFCLHLVSPIEKHFSRLVARMKVRYDLSSPPPVIKYSNIINISAVRKMVRVSAFRWIIYKRNKQWGGATDVEEAADRAHN